jgi:peptidoglycan/LPS O-acetylase OafA/YrhL
MPSPDVAGKARFYPGLDGLRALATVAVLISHFFPERSPIQRAFHWGRFGVLLFFVLSGFLITGLLLRGRDAVRAGQVSKGQVLRAFMARRLLRIGPIYYLVLLIGTLCQYAPIVDYLAWHLTYTGNIAMTYFHAKLAQATHLWSLCVEEQFYLLWPLAVLLTPPKRLTALAVILAVMGLAYDIQGALRGQGFEETHLVLQGCTDALGLGGLLAMLSHADATGARAGRLAHAAALVGAPLLVFAQGFRFQVGLTATERLPYRIPGDLGLALVSLALVYVATLRGPSPIRSFLELPPLRFLGRISYGIYLYHLFLIPIGRAIADRASEPQPSRGLEMFLTYGAISVCLATVSWYAIEAPINRLKRHFPYPGA